MRIANVLLATSCIYIGFANPAFAGGGEIKGNVTSTTKIKNGAGCVAGRDCAVGSVLVKGGKIDGNVTLDTNIKNGVGCIAGRDCAVGSVVVTK